jgi:hypothetical protein
VEVLLASQSAQIFLISCLIASKEHKHTDDSKVRLPGDGLVLDPLDDTHENRQYTPAQKDELKLEDAAEEDQEVVHFESLSLRENARRPPRARPRQLDAPVVKFS